MTKLEASGSVRLRGLKGDQNASAVTRWQRRLLVASDELAGGANCIHLLEPDGDAFVAATAQRIPLDAPGGDAAEMDLEGIALDGDVLYVLGSHSARRRKVDEDADYLRNRAALTEAPRAEPARDVLLRVHLQAGAGGNVQVLACDRTSLATILDGSEPFRTARGMASKENGVDAEGLAFWRGALYVGFRGPVLRGNLVPILRCRFASPVVEHETLFVNLGGRGVRDLAAVEEGLLILAGPVGEGPGSYRLYLWDGRDGVPGKGSPAWSAGRVLRTIGDLVLPGQDPDDDAGPKAEGMAVLETHAGHWEVLVVFDGLAGGGAQRYRVPRGAR